MFPKASKANSWIEHDEKPLNLGEPQNDVCLVLLPLARSRSARAGVLRRVFVRRAWVDTRRDRSHRKRSHSIPPWHMLQLFQPQHGVHQTCNKCGPIATDVLWSDAPFAQASRRNEHGEIKTARARPAFARRLLLWIRHGHCFRCLCTWCVPSPLEATRPLQRPFCGCRLDEAWHGLRQDPFHDCRSLVAAATACFSGFGREKGRGREVARPQRNQRWRQWRARTDQRQMRCLATSVDCTNRASAPPRQHLGRRPRRRLARRCCDQRSASAAAVGAAAAAAARVRRERQARERRRRVVVWVRRVGGGGADVRVEDERHVRVARRRADHDAGRLRERRRSARCERDRHDGVRLHGERLLRAALLLVRLVVRAPP